MRMCSGGTAITASYKEDGKSISSTYSFNTLCMYRNLAWRSGATFVKLFPGSSLGATHVREMRGPLPEIETIVTGGVDGSNAPGFLAAGAVAVGIGSAIVRATLDERLRIVAAVAR